MDAQIPGIGRKLTVVTTPAILHKSGNGKGYLPHIRCFLRRHAGGLSDLHRRVYQIIPGLFSGWGRNYLYGFCEDNTGEALYSRIQETVDAARAAGADYIIAGHLGENG